MPIQAHLDIRLGAGKKFSINEHPPVAIGPLCWRHYVTKLCNTKPELVVCERGDFTLASPAPKLYLK